jgi:hypothetical protein
MATRIGPLLRMLARSSAEAALLDQLFNSSEKRLARALLLCRAICSENVLDYPCVSRELSRASARHSGGHGILTSNTPNPTRSAPVTCDPRFARRPHMTPGCRHRIPCASISSGVCPRNAEWGKHAIVSALSSEEEEPLMFQRAPPRFDHGVRELQFEGKTGAARP